MLVMMVFVIQNLMKGKAELLSLILVSVTVYQQSPAWFSTGCFSKSSLWGLCRPILSIPGDNGITDRLIHCTRTGIVGRDVGTVKAFILKSLQAWRSNRAVDYDPDLGALSGFTRQVQAKRLSEIFHSVALPARDAAPHKGGESTALSCELPPDSPSMLASPSVAGSKNQARGGRTPS